MSLPSPARRPAAPLGWRVTTWLVLVLILLFLVLMLIYGLVGSLGGAAAARPLAILAILSILGALLALLFWHWANQRLVKRLGVDEQHMRHPSLAYAVLTTLLVGMLQFLIGTDHPVARVINWLVQVAAAGFFGWAVLAIRARVLRVFAAPGSAAGSGGQTSSP